MRIVKFKPFLKVLILYFVSIFFIYYLVNEILNVDKLVIDDLNLKFTKDQIFKYMEFKNNWFFLSYVFSIFYFVIKVTIISSFLYIYIHLFTDLDVRFKKIQILVIKSEFIFLLVPIFKLFYFLFIYSNYKLEDFQNFYPFSALQIIGYNIDKWWIYPLQTINLFELGYCLLLANYIGKETNTNSDEGLKIVGFSYVPVLFLWIVLLMFLTLNLT